MLVLDAPLRERRIFKEYDRIEIAAAEADADWRCAMASATTRSPSTLLQAKREGLPYLESRAGGST